MYVINKRAIPEKKNECGCWKACFSKTHHSYNLKKKLSCTTWSNVMYYLFNVSSITTPTFI